MKLRHIGVIVDDIDRALTFYRDLLGFKEVDRKIEKSYKIQKALNFSVLGVEWVKLKAGGETLLELVKYENLHEDCKAVPGLQHFALTVNNLDKLYKKLCKENIVLFSEPIKKDNVKLLFCNDFDGNVIEMVEDIKQ